MSKAASNRRHRFSGVEASEKFPVEYRFFHAKNGNRHLVIVFANFSAPEDFGWSNGVLDNIRANVLWIRDRFDGENSYYMCKGMDFSIEASVTSLIARVMNALSLTPADCTLIGSSKGGSAALYFGLRYGFQNIVAIAPQFMIGSYVREMHPRAAQFMTGDSVSDENVRILDSILPDLVVGGTNAGANIYLFSSPADEQYHRQIEPFLGLFQRYANFNFVFTDSPFVTDHTEVAGRNVPIIMGIVNLLIDGIVPRMGLVRNGHEDPHADRSAINAYLEATALAGSGPLAPPVVSVPVSNQQAPGAFVRFVGSARGAAKVSFWENGQRLGSSNVAADGGWTWAPGKPWAMGNHAVKAFAVDSTGAESERTTVTFTILNTLAAPVVSAPAPYQLVPAAAVGFMGSAWGAVRVELWENGKRLGTSDVAADGSWIWESGWSWDEGEHVVKVFAVDSTGTESERTSVAITIPTALYRGF